MGLRHLVEICGFSPSIFRSQSLFPMEKLQKNPPEVCKIFAKETRANLAIGNDEFSLLISQNRSKDSRPFRWAPYL